MSIADELSKLDGLRKSGVLNDQEFASAKARLLASDGQDTFASPPRGQLIRTAADAEAAAAEFMRHVGFSDAKVTSSGRDGGIDVVATDAVAQVKAQMKPVGRPELQQLHGAAQGRSTIFFSLEAYTIEARVWGDSVGMALFRFDLQGQPSPVNRRAKDVLAAAQPAGRETPKQGDARAERRRLALLNEAHELAAQIESLNNSIAAISRLRNSLTVDRAQLRAGGWAQCLSGRPGADRELEAETLRSQALAADRKIEEKLAEREQLASRSREVRELLGLAPLDDDPSEWARLQLSSNERERQAAIREREDRIQTLKPHGKEGSRDEVQPSTVRSSSPNQGPT